MKNEKTIIQQFINCVKKGDHPNCVEKTMNMFLSFLNMIRIGVFMTPIDLKDALFLIQIHAKHQKTLKFL